MISKINHTQIPNDFIDQWMSKLTPKATLVFLAICRKTIGWHKDTDSISVNQITELTGLTKNTVLSAIKELEEFKLILKESFSTENVNLPNRFTVNFSTGVVQEMHGGGAGDARGGGARDAPTKEIILNKITKEKDNTLLTEKSIPSCQKSQYPESKKTVVRNEELFNQFWEEYNLKKDKTLTIKVWNKLSLKQQQEAISNIQPYLNSLSDKKYQKKPSNYLSHGTYEDDFSSKSTFRDYE